MQKFSSAFRKASVAAVAVLGLGLGAAGMAGAQDFSQLTNQVNQAIAGLPPQVQDQVKQFVPSESPTGPKQLVAFGDSFSANAGKSGPRGLQPAQTPLVANCATDMENWPKIAAGELNKTLGDWTCNGTGAMPKAQLMGYLEAAIQHGDIGEGTEKVVLMYGGMDTLAWIDAGGNVIAKDLDVPFFRDIVRDFSNRVHQAAPNAQIVLASYPECATNDQLCLWNTPGQVTPIPAPGATKVQEGMRDAIRDVAAANGAGFIDVYAATIGHGTCQPDDSQRYVAGFIDPAIGPMTNHPTVAGEIAMGHIIADGLR